MNNKIELCELSAIRFGWVEYTNADEASNNQNEQKWSVSFEFSIIPSLFAIKNEY